MSLAAAVATAVRNVLYQDNHLLDLSLVMDQPPYSYDTYGKIDFFLQGVAAELAKDTPPVALNVAQVDHQGAMGDKVIDLETRIAAASAGAGGC